METDHGGKHTYSMEEVMTFSNMINDTLKKDEDCQEKLPINPNSDDLFHVFDDGIVLCKLILSLIHI